MHQSTFYKYAALILLVLNISMVAFFFLTKPKKHRPRPGFKTSARSILEMDESQHETFLKMADKHQQKLDALHEQQQDLLKPYFNQLINTSDSKSNFPDAIKDLEKQKIEATYQHFQEVKSILRQKQLPDFEEFVNHALKRINSNFKKNKKPGKSF